MDESVRCCIKPGDVARDVGLGRRCWRTLERMRIGVFFSIGTLSTPRLGPPTPPPLAGQERAAVCAGVQWVVVVDFLRFRGVIVWRAGLAGKVNTDRGVLG